MTNLLTVPTQYGASTAFGITAEEIEQARKLADYFAALATIEWADAANEIERQAPWLSRLAEEMRERPIEATGLGLALAALILQIVSAAQTQPGITPEQFERLIQEVHGIQPSPASSQSPGPEQSELPTPQVPHRAP